MIQVTALAFAPDGRTLAAGCADGSLVLWDLAEARRLAAIAEHRGPVWSLAFSHGAGSVLASGVGQILGPNGTAATSFCSLSSAVAAPA